MRFSSVLAAAALTSVATAYEFIGDDDVVTVYYCPTATSSASATNPTASDPADVYKAQATALTRSPTSNVKGKAFDRYVSIWFENTDFDMTAADPNFAWFAAKGITLSGLVCVTHPSEPNYMATGGGDYFGLNGDPFTAVPSNVSSIIDLLEDKGISWAMYQEDMPYSGYQGFDWVNQQTGANDYVRKHNPAILFDSVTNNPDRLAQIKNTTMFQKDLANNQLPQWMFITPNMTSDAHDSDITVAGNWLRGFLEPLLDDPNFMDNTLVLITFDENETYSIQNNVFSILLGDAVPSELVGTTDAHYYNHYSELATVEANWDLHTLGRYDVGANVFKNVADKTGDVVRTYGTYQDTPLSGMFYNYSYPGIYNNAGAGWAPQPVPNVDANYAGRTVLPSIISTWEALKDQTPYTDALEIPDGYHWPVYPAN